MSSSIQVHWHEGLFLQPHHLQRLQRGLAEQARDDRRRAWAYPYGVVEARLSGRRARKPDDPLRPPARGHAERPRSRFSRNGGTCPCSTSSRRSRPAAATFHGAARRAAVVRRPRQHRRSRRGRPREAALSRRRNQRRRRKHRRQCRSPCSSAVIGARLLLDTDDRSDLETIPLLHILPATGESVGLPCGPAASPAARTPTSWNWPMAASAAPWQTSSCPPCMPCWTGPTHPSTS